MIENDKCRIKLYKQSHIGASIFELSKVLMCNFHYNFIEKKYDVEAELLFTDTGNWMCEIETLNVYENFYKDIIIWFQEIFKRIKI